MKLNELINVPGSKKKPMRVGRGIGSGKGKTCGRGVKGQKSRSGVSIKTEGGQTPIIKRLPKRGFNCDKSINYIALSTDKIIELVANKKISNEVNNEILQKAGFIKSIKQKVKLLKGGLEFKHKVTINLDAVSKSAKELVEKSGGKVE